MVRTYKHRANKAYSKEDLEAAINVAKHDGMKVLVAAGKYNVPCQPLLIMLRMPI